ncbi:MAG: DUF6046 domain-containing protein [Bacteroidetes bacterium]|nr:DUF6046 domain-containing protein [Bacteroidota bacterium]
MVVFELSKILGMARGTIGLPFPQVLKDESHGMVANEFPENITYVNKYEKQSKRGKPLYKQNALGVWYFMPVYLNGIEFPNAYINISTQKTLVETPMTSVEGTVKEIINNQDYNIKLIFTAINYDGTYPEEWLYTVKNLYNKKEILTLDCAVSDAFIQPKENCIIVGMPELANMQGIENAQTFELTLKSDFYLELEVI